MTEQHEKLRQALEQLQSQLEELRGVDPQVAGHLDETIRDAHAVLSGQAAEAEKHKSLLDEFNDALLQYEASHPTLAGNLGSVIDALGRMGI